MTRRSKAPAPTGPLADVFGVRHLSPNGAHQLARHLDRVDPTAVLIEGPSDAGHLIEHFGHAQTAPPVAVLAWSRGARGAAVRSVVYPFARYSPEWVAATWAIGRQRVVRFIDLPAATLLALDPAAGGSDAGGEACAAVARASGDSDHDTWWERRFEHAGEGYREAVAALGDELRAIDAETANGPWNLQREAYMRRAIRKALDEGHEAARVVVVCGAFHAGAMVWELAPMADGEARRLPKSDAGLMLIPYGNFRLSAQGGNEAGNRAPGYHEMLYDALRGRSPRTLPTRVLVRVAVELRRRGSVRSSAEVIEAVRLAEALGSLGDAAAPTLADLHAAAVTCLGGGDEGAVREAFAAVAVGDQVGSLPRGISRTALQDDVQHQLDALRLTSLVKDAPAEGVGSAEGTLVLDRRVNRQVKRDDAAVRERSRSVLLHRLAALELGLAHDVTTAEDRRDNTFKERWRLAWSPESELRMVERAMLGDTVESASERHLLDGLAACDSVGAATAVALVARDCDLGACLDAAVARVQALAVDDAGFRSVAGAVWKLARMIREPDVTGLDVTALWPLLAQLFLRAALLVDAAARCDDAAARAVAAAMDDVHRVAHYDWDGGALASGRWRAALDALADDDGANPYVAGVSCALMIEHGEVDDEALGRRVARRISPGMEPARVAGWFEGLASRNPYALLSREGLWRAMTTFVDALDERAFRRALPGLRRAFSGFSEGEARAVAAAVAGAWRAGPASGLPEASEADAQAVAAEVADALEGIDFDL